ncbi:MAG: hypothetical protein WB678_21250, partial [Stellaceae bacterium]
MGQRIDDHRGQLGMARRRSAGQPDIARLDTQIRPLMPPGFVCNQLGGDRPGDRLADQRTQI